MDPDGAGPLRRATASSTSRGAWPWTTRVRSTWPTPGTGAFTSSTPTAPSCASYFNGTNGELGDPYALFGPRGIAVDGQGNLLVADTSTSAFSSSRPRANWSTRWAAAA
ncbi:MAG: hypothetical protein R2854_03235 [Caldilineaceae bacterium]